MAYVFDQYESVKGNRSRGGEGKLNVLGGTALPAQVSMGLTFKTPCSAIIEELRALFNDFLPLCELRQRASTRSRGDVCKDERGRPKGSGGTQKASILRHVPSHSREALELRLEYQ